MPYIHGPRPTGNARRGGCGTPPPVNLLEPLDDAHFMRLALAEARTAAAAGEVPVGAVVALEGRVIARAHNRTEALRDATAHAEMLALTAAQEHLGSRVLAACTLYVTLEPCVMCAGALAWTRVGRVVAGAADPKGGFGRFGRGLLHPRTAYVEGCEGEACGALLTDWFRAKRGDGPSAEGHGPGDAPGPGASGGPAPEPDGGAPPGGGPTLRGAVLLAALLGAAVAGAQPFTEASAEAGLHGRTSSFGLAVGDPNGDGHPDLFTGNHWLGGEHGSPPVVWINDGTGRFTPDTLPWPDADPDVHGAAFVDLDGDGRDALLVAQGRRAPNRFWTLSPEGGWTETAAARGLDDPEGRGRAPLFVDADGDGLLDVLLPKMAPLDGQTPTVLLRQEADGRFAPDPQAADFGEGLHAAFAQLTDLDDDHRPELFLGFEELKRWYHLKRYPWSGFRGPRESAVGDVAVGDFDGDGRMELFLARGERRSALRVRAPGAWQVYLRSDGVGEQGLRFRAPGPVRARFEVPEIRPRVVAGAAGAGSPVGSTTGVLDPADPAWYGSPPRGTADSGAVFLGLDTASGAWEVGFLWPRAGVDLMLHLEADGPLALDSAWGFRPEAPGLEARLLVPVDTGYADAAAQRGLGGIVDAASVVAFDADLDQDLDLFVHGGVLFPVPSGLWANDGTGRFTRVPAHGDQAGPGDLDTAGLPDAVVLLDADGDGDLDLVAARGGSRFGRGPYRLWRNDQQTGHHWLALDLVGTRGAAAAIGADVTVHTPGHAQRRIRGGGMHRLAQDHARLHWGLGPNPRADSVVIRWPGGFTQVLRDLPADTLHRLVEPAPCGAPRELAAVWEAGDTARFSWRPAPGAAPLEFKLTLTVDSGQAPVPPFTFTGDTAARLGGLHAGVRYGWKVRALCAWENGPFASGEALRRPVPPAGGRLALRPNPAADRVAVRADGLAPGPWRLRLLDPAGRTLREAALPDGPGALDWDLRGLAPGGYRVLLLGPQGPLDARTLVVAR